MSFFHCSFMIMFTFLFKSIIRHHCGPGYCNRTINACTWRASPKFLILAIVFCWFQKTTLLWLRIKGITLKKTKTKKKPLIHDLDFAEISVLLEQEHWHWWVQVISQSRTLKDQEKFSCLQISVTPNIPYCHLNSVTDTGQTSKNPSLGPS